MPLGLLELNAFIAGAELAAAALALRALFGWPPIPDVPDKLLSWVVGILGLSVLGLAVEGLAGLTERMFTREGNIVTERPFLRGKAKNLRGWYKDLTAYKDANWTDAQRWIWTSPHAAAEYGRRRLRILVARNTAFNVYVVGVAAAILVGERAGTLLSIGTYVASVLLSLLFVYAWLDANRAYHRAVADAGAVDKR